MDPIVTKDITVKDIQLRSLATPRRLPVARRYQVNISVDNTLFQTGIARESKGSHTSWDDELFFDGHDRSVLFVEVYQKHHIGRSELIGSLTDSIGGLLGKSKDGALEEPLLVNTSHGPIHCGIMIGFSLSVELLGKIDVDERQAAASDSGATDETVGVLVSTSITVDLTSLESSISKNTVDHTGLFETTWRLLLERMELFSSIVADVTQINPNTSLAFSVLSATSQVLANQKNFDEQIIRLVGAMSDAFSFVHDTESLKPIKKRLRTIILLIQQVTECGYFITEYAKQKDFWVLTKRYTLSVIDAKITEYENKLRELKAALLDGVTVQTGVTVVRMLDIVERTAEAIDLNDIPYALGARYTHEKECLPGTRESLIREICDVINDPGEDAPRVCLLTGVAGSGKSAVAHSIARLHDGQKRLGSSYCFSSTDSSRRNPQTLFSTIARDLADHDPQYKSSLWEVVKGTRALRTSTSPSEQVERLIIEPSEHLQHIGPLVIVIDALDESGDPASRQSLLRAISKQIAGNAFPTNIRFLITARPESDILSALPSSSHLVHKKMADIPLESIDGDIHRFIYHSLHHYSELESSWPDEEWCHLLVHHSQQLFLWAATACDFIKFGATGLTPSKQFKVILQTNKSATTLYPLDDLYRTILGQLFTFSEAQKAFKEVMAVMFALKEPLSFTSFFALFESFEDLDMQYIIKYMGSLLYGVSDEKKPILPLHSSFRDFLLDEARSSIFHVDIQPQHSLYIGQALLACMRKMLRFNLCNLEDSQVFNKAIPDLPSRIKSAIPHHLAYSCQYWMVHLQHAGFTQDLFNEVTSFFKDFFPYWLEAMSLLSYSSPLSFILSAIETCTIIEKWAKDSDIATMASEASRFIQVFSPVLRESTPHLYLSAMPQTPTSSPLCTLWLNHLKNHGSMTSGHPTDWPAEVHILNGHKSGVNCVTYSPDGSHIASGSFDNSIIIWNAATCQPVAGLLLGHTDSVTCVAYSPDGSHIVSGSQDKTIRIWNATTGQPIADPFLGHQDGVLSVAYSPDERHVVSGSQDKTIRIWDVVTGELVMDPLEGDLLAINSVAYSPDGKYISGSYGNTIRVWNSATGQPMEGLFEGHKDSVSSISFSPDGNHIVSGSNDNTIRVWDATTGQLVAGPFEGHTWSINSVAYAPDGKHIVSSSWDKTIRIWDSTTGKLAADPLEGHLNFISSVAYSPDGRYIVSGSWDKTVRVWNVTPGQTVASSVEGHTAPVTSIAYSPDGSHIVSGSWDKTIRIWDAITGQLIMDPLVGHTNLITSVIYSPDGSQIVSSSSDKTIRIWNATTGQLVAGPLEGHEDSVTSVAYSPDGSHIVSGSQDKRIRVWDSTNGQLFSGPFNVHDGPITSVTYSSDGNYIVTGSQDKTIGICNAITGKLAMAPLEGHKYSVTCVACSKDGNHIISGSDDQTIRIWNVTTGQLVAGPFEGHTDSITSVAYMSDGNHIVSASNDNTIRIWNVSTSKCVAGPFQGHQQQTNSIVCSPDGKYLASGSHDYTIKVWRIQDMTSFKDLQESDGWIKTSNGACFGWIAPWNRYDFCLPFHSLVISSKRAYQHNAEGSLSGKTWMSCWDSAS